MNDAAKIWRESPVQAQHKVIDALVAGLEAAQYQAKHTRSTDPDVLTVYRLHVEAFESAIVVLEYARDNWY